VLTPQMPAQAQLPNPLDTILASGLLPGTLGSLLECTSVRRDGERISDGGDSAVNRALVRFAIFRNI